MDPFDTLGLPPRFDLELIEIEQRYRDLQKTLHPDKYVQASASERRASLSHAVTVNEAYRALKDDLKRAEALVLRFGGVPEDKRGAQNPELLMEVMELRESLGDARADRDIARARKLSAEVRTREQNARAALKSALDSLANSNTPALLAKAEADLSRLRYYRRFQDEVDALEEEMLE